EPLYDSVHEPRLRRLRLLVPGRRFGAEELFPGELHHRRDYGALDAALLKLVDKVEELPEPGTDLAAGAHGHIGAFAGLHTDKPLRKALEEARRFHRRRRADEIRPGRRRLRGAREEVGDTRGEIAYAGRLPDGATDLPEPARNVAHG